MAWGVTPTTFVGHSLGEYAAAHLAGVLTLDGALDLIVARATPDGPRQRHRRRDARRAAARGATCAPSSRRPLSVATINADDECVVAGPADDIVALQRAARRRRRRAPTLIPLAAAAHSSMLDPILPDFLDAVRGVELSPPQVPYLSNLTGTWITAEQATDPQYWVDHLRHTVRFSDCLATLLADGPLVLIELGPGQSLSSYARRQAISPTAAIPALRHPNQDVDDTAYSLNAFARGWAAGVDVDLGRFAGDGRRRLRLPTYPFRKERHWIEPGAGRIGAACSRRRVTAAAAVARRPPLPSASPISPTRSGRRSWIERPLVAPAAAPVGPWVVVGDPGRPVRRRAGAAS